MPNSTASNRASRFTFIGRLRGVVLFGLIAGLAPVSAGFALGGCASAPEEPDASTGGSGGTGGSAGGTGGTTGGSGGSGGGGLSCNITAVFTKACWGIGCHGNMLPAAELDMQSPGVETRVLNVPASHLHITNGTEANCMPEVRIDGNNPDNSLILKKLAGTHSCGDQMPVAPRVVNDADEACLREWVFMVAGKPLTPAGTGGTGSGGTGTGGTTGGTGGTTGGTGGTTGGTGGTGGTTGGTGGSGGG